MDVSKVTSLRLQRTMYSRQSHCPHRHTAESQNTTVCQAHSPSTFPTAHPLPPASCFSSLHQATKWAGVLLHQGSCRPRLRSCQAGAGRGRPRKDSYAGVTERIKRAEEEIGDDQRLQTEYISHTEMLDHIQEALDSMAPGVPVTYEERRAHLTEQYSQLPQKKLADLCWERKLSMKSMKKAQLVEKLVAAELGPPPGSVLDESVGVNGGGSQLPDQSGSVASSSGAEVAERPRQLEGGEAGSEPSSSDRSHYTEEELRAMSKDEMQEKLKELGLVARGKKDLLLKRLNWHYNPSAYTIPSEADLQAETVEQLKERARELGVIGLAGTPGRRTILRALVEAYTNISNKLGREYGTTTSPPTGDSTKQVDSVPETSQSDTSSSDVPPSVPSPSPSPASSISPPSASSPAPPAPTPPASTRIPPPASAPPRGDPVPVIFTDHRKKRRIVVKQGQHPEDIATEVVKGLTSRFNASTMVVTKGLNATVLALRALASASAQLSQKGFLMGFQHWHLPDSPEREDRNFAFVLYTIERFKLPVKDTYKVARTTYPPKLAAFLSRQLLDHETPSCSLEIRSALALIRALEGTLITRKIMHRPFKDLLLFVRVQPDHLPRATNDLGRYVMQLLAVKVQRSKPTALSAYRWESERLQEMQEAALLAVPIPDEEETLDDEDGNIYEQVGRGYDTRQDS